MLSTLARRVLILVVCLSFGVRLTAAAPLRQSSRIQYNETVQSEISENAAEEKWEFDGHTGDLILIDMRADGSSLDTYLTLLDPFGNPLFSDDDGGEGVNSRIGPYRLPSGGIYTILAGRYGGSGGYLLELKNLSTIPTITPGKPLVGVVDSSQPTDYFLLPPGNEEILWRLAVTDDQLNSDPYLALYGASGLLTSTEIDGSQGIDPIVPLSDETYIVVVSWNTSSSGGPYQIDLNTSDAVLLDTDLPQNGALDYDHTEERHYFRGEEGQTVRLTIEVEGNIAAAVEVDSLDGSQILFSTSGDNAREITVTLTISRTTVYVVRVWDSSYGGERGSYALHLERLP